MSFAKTQAFAAMKADLRARSTAQRDAHARDMAAVDLVNQADTAGTLTMTPEEFAFSMSTGVDPAEVEADEHEDDR